MPPPPPLLPTCQPQVLFDTLRDHGGAFSEAFWARIFERVLMPIFDAVRAEVRAPAAMTTH
jgi:brefeldin A-inhibited guanine nucleotide-exchange protein